MARVLPVLGRRPAEAAGAHVGGVLRGDVRVPAGRPARLEQALPSLRLPVRVVVGQASPMPRSAATDTASRILGAVVEEVPRAGHFPWLDSPGCVRAALQRLAG